MTFEEFCQTHQMTEEERARCEVFLFALRVMSCRRLLHALLSLD